MLQVIRNPSEPRTRPSEPLAQKLTPRYRFGPEPRSRARVTSRGVRFGSASAVRTPFFLKLQCNRWYTRTAVRSCSSYNSLSMLIQYATCGNLFTRARQMTVHLLPLRLAQPRFRPLPPSRWRHPEISSVGPYRWNSIVRTGYANEFSGEPR